MQALAIYFNKQMLLLRHQLYEATLRVHFSPPRAPTPLFGNGTRAHGIRKISGVLTKIGKFDIVLMYYISIARLIPIIKLTFFFLGYIM